MRRRPGATRHRQSCIVVDPKTPINTLAKSLAADFQPIEPDLLGRYLQDIVDWNDRVGLVSKRSVLPSLERLVRQSAWVLRFLRDRGVIAPSGDQSVADVGSGAGFPGIVWKLIQPSLQVTLFERRQKKATFLQRTRVILGLADVEIAEGDAAELGTYERFSERFDVTTSFGVASPSTIARLVEPLVKPGGHYATVRPREEMFQPDKIGRSLILTDATDHQCGRFCLYRRAPSTAAGENPDKK
jgi:16S rRNA (guanine(527)-N(7))-methyltransferase RsmG